MFKRLTFGVVLMLVVPATLIVAAPVSEAAVPSTPLLTDVQVQDMGTFDRVPSCSRVPSRPASSRRSTSRVRPC